MKHAFDRHPKRALILALALAGATALSVQAAGLKRASDLSRSPSPLSVVSREELDRTKWRTPADLSTIAGVTPANGAPGSPASTIAIRGRGNVTQGDASPLFIVDGQRVASIDEIKPDDIQQIDIIRGNAASAIYGTAAICGVINITTKVPREPDGDLSGSGDLFQNGFGTMAAANIDPVGQSVYSIYGGGGSGRDAGIMFASAAKLRWQFDGPLFEGGPAADQARNWPLDRIGAGLADEMLGIQSTYDTALGRTMAPKQQGDFLAWGLYGLGFDRALAGGIVRDRVPQWSGWPSDIVNADRLRADIKVNPGLYDQLWDFSPGRTPRVLPPDNNPWTIDLAFGEPNLGRDSQEDVRPNDPLFKKPDSVAREVGGVLKKGFGALLQAGGFGIGTSNESSQAEDQWGLHAVGFTPMGAGTSAWDVVDGREENVVVAVIDSGLDLAHPDRPRFLWTNADEIPDNGVDDDGNGYADDIHGWNFVAESNAIDDDYGHGTFVTGIIAAHTDNGEGIAGIDPGARIMTLKASNGDGVAHSLAIYRALRYAVDNGARVINISLGRRGLSRLEQIGINYADAMGCIVVVAAGNQSSDIDQFGPPGARRVMAVASLDIDGSRRSQSNQGVGVAIAAPGESIYSLTAQNGKHDGHMIPILAGDYHRLNGTSFAAPFVTGTAALIWSQRPGLTNRQVTDMILAGAADIDDPGWDPKTGMGRLDARAAVSMLPESAFAPRITDWIINRDAQDDIRSVDVYGVIRGPLTRYTLSVGEGTNPDDWKPVYGPSDRMVMDGLIARIRGEHFRDGSHWSLRLSATGPDNRQHTQIVEIRPES